MPFDPHFDPTADLFGATTGSHLLQQELEGQHDGAVGGMNMSGEEDALVSDEGATDEHRNQGSPLITFTHVRSSAARGEGSEDEQEQYIATSDILVPRKRKRSDLLSLEAAAGTPDRFHNTAPAQASASVTHTINTAPQPRTTVASRGTKASNGRKKNPGGTGRGPGRWPKGSKKSDYGNAGSGPGLPPGWLAGQKKAISGREAAAKAKARKEAKEGLEPGAGYGKGGPDKSSESKRAAEETISSAKPTGQAPSEDPTSTPFPIPHVSPAPGRRGRPPGWRLGAGSYAALRGETPPDTAKPNTKKAAAARTYKPKGRPPRSLTLVAKEIFRSLRPKFNSYLCEWQGCQADLQNFETLQRHVMIVHGQSETCQWGTCAKTHEHGGRGKAQEAGGGMITTTTTVAAADNTAPPPPPPAAFPTRHAFESHMYAAHLKRILWELGDGPRNTSDIVSAADRAAAGWQTRGDLADPPPRYLFDERSGRQVTPSVRGQQCETDEERRARRMRQRASHDEWLLTAPVEPEWTPAQRAVIAEALEDKNRRRREMEAYYDLVCAPGEPGRSMQAWRGLLVAMPERSALKATAAVAGGGR